MRFRCQFIFYRNKIHFLCGLRKDDALVEFESIVAKYVGMSTVNIQIQNSDEFVAPFNRKLTGSNLFYDVGNIFEMIIMLVERAREGNNYSWRTCILSFAFCDEANKLDLEIIIFDAIYVCCMVYVVYSCDVMEWCDGASKYTDLALL